MTGINNLVSINNMSITKKNHFIPCFWSAYWNYEYLSLKRENSNHQSSARNEKVFVLNIKNNSIFNKKTEDIFFEKNAGIAIITPEAALNYALKNAPETYEDVKKKYNTDVTLDFENHFTIMEQCYKGGLEELVLTNDFIGDEQKAQLCSLLFYQILRHPNLLNPIEKMFKQHGMEKFEMFYSLKEKMSSIEELAKLSIPFVFPKWKIYKLKKNVFPLSDNPILIKNESLMVALAPNIMLEINLKENTNIIQPCIIKKRISYFKKREFIKRTIISSNKEIIFGDVELLEKIKKLKVYIKHSVIINAR